MMASHTICVSARVVNETKFVKHIVNKKLLKVSPKLTISEIVDEAIGDSDVDDETDYAPTNGNFSAKLSITESSEPFSIENGEPLNTALEFNPGIKYLQYTINIDSNNNNSTCSKQIHSDAIATKDAFAAMMKVRGTNQRAQLVDLENAARVTAKDKLFNKVCTPLTENKCYFPSSMTKDDVKKNVQIIANCLWYMDGNWKKIVERSAHDKIIAPIPERYVIPSVCMCAYDWVLYKFNVMFT